MKRDRKSRAAASRPYKPDRGEQSCKYEHGRNGHTSTKNSWRYHVSIVRKPECVIAWNPNYFQADFRKRKLGVRFPFTVTLATPANIAREWHISKKGVEYAVLDKTGFFCGVLAERDMDEALFPKDRPFTATGYFKKVSGGVLLYIEKSKEALGLLSRTLNVTVGSRACAFEWSVSDGEGELVLESPSMCFEAVPKDSKQSPSLIVFDGSRLVFTISPRSKAYAKLSALVGGKNHLERVEIDILLVRNLRRDPDYYCAARFVFTESVTGSR